MAYLPIYLRNVIVYPTFVHPQQDIGIQIIVILQSSSFATFRRCSLVTIYSERRNTELYPRLALTNCLMKFFDKYIYIVSSPLISVGKSTTICSEAYVIRKIFSRIRIRIEIIIHMNGIYVISVYDVAHNLAYILSVVWKSWIEIKLSSILHKQFRMFVVRMQRRQSGCSLSTGTIRINPCVQFHTTLVAFINHKLQRIPCRRWL